MQQQVNKMGKSADIHMYVVLHRHEHGVDVTAHLSEEEADQHVREVVEFWWDVEVNERLMAPRQVPQDLEEAVQAYSDIAGESIETHVFTMDTCRVLAALGLLQRAGGRRGIRGGLDVDGLRLEVMASFQTMQNGLESVTIYVEGLAPELRDQLMSAISDDYALDGEK